MRADTTARGFGLIEIVVVIGMMATVVLAVASFSVSSLRLAREDRLRLAALGLADEALEATVNLARDRWYAMPGAGAYHPVVEAGTGAWSFVSGPETVTLNGVPYARQVVLSGVGRAALSDGHAVGDVVASGGYADPGTRRATVTVSWPEASGAPGSVTVSDYVARWARRSWTQSSWTGGAGQSAWSDPTRYFSDDGDVQIVGGAVQLKGASSGGTTPAGGTTSNPGFDASTAGWTFAPWVTGSSVSGIWQANGGNPGGYARIRFQDRNASVGGYWYQPIAVTAAAVSTATAALDWSVIRHDGGTTGLRAYLFVDTTSGPPVLGQQVWTSPELTAATPWARVPPIDVSGRIAGSGTYYLKLAVYGTFGPQGPDVRVGFDNASLSWTGTVTSSGTTYPPEGIVESSTFDAGSSPEYLALSWVRTAPSGTSVTFQAASSATGASWTYVGPDGTPATEFTDPAGALAHASLDGNRYVRYRAYLRTSDATKTPTLSGFRLEYSP